MWSTAAIPQVVDLVKPSASARQAHARAHESNLATALVLARCTLWFRRFPLDRLDPRSPPRTKPHVAHTGCGPRCNATKLHLVTPFLPTPGQQGVDPSSQGSGGKEFCLLKAHVHLHPLFPAPSERTVVPALEDAEGAGARLVERFMPGRPTVEGGCQQAMYPHLSRPGRLAPSEQLAIPLGEASPDHQVLPA